MAEIPPNLSIAAGSSFPPSAFIPKEETPFTIPAHWSWLQLQYLCTYIRRGKGPRYVESLTRLAISQKCVRWHGLEIVQARGWDPDEFTRLDEDRILRDKDILWNSTGTGTIGRLTMIPEGFSSTVAPMAADSHVTVIRTNQHLIPDYLSHYLASKYVQQLVTEKLSTGTTNQKELNLGKIKVLPIPTPPLDEQKLIVDALNQGKKRINDARFRINKGISLLKDIKQGIISAAVSGNLASNT